MAMRKPKRGGSHFGSPFFVVSAECLRRHSNLRYEPFGQILITGSERLSRS